MKKVKLLKVIALILSLIIMFPLFACDNVGDGESNNPPTPLTPQEQTYFLDNFLDLPQLIGFEEFDSISEAEEYIKTWNKNYEMFIPNVEEKDSITISIRSFSDRDEKEKFSHLVKYVITKAEPFYKINGHTSLYIKGDYKKEELRFEMRDSEVLHVADNFVYSYNEDGGLKLSSEDKYYQTYSYAIKSENHIIANGTLEINDGETKTPEEVKALIFDNLIPVEQQKNKEIKTDFELYDENYPAGRQKLDLMTHEEFYQAQEKVEIICKLGDYYCYLLNGENFDSVKYVTRIYFFGPTEAGNPLAEIKSKIEIKKDEDKKVKLEIFSIKTPISLIDLQDEKTYEYTFEIAEELQNGYKFIIKNGYGNIFSGTITAEDKTDINLEEIEQKLLSNIILIKGE